MPMTFSDADFAVLRSRVDAQDVRQDKLESKLEKEIESLKAELVESNKKLDEIKDLLNQAKGAANATKIVWGFAAAGAAVLGWFGIKGFGH